MYFCSVLTHRSEKSFPHLCPVLSPLVFSGFIIYCSGTEIITIRVKGLVTLKILRMRDTHGGQNFPPLGRKERKERNLRLHCSFHGARSM